MATASTSVLDSVGGKNLVEIDRTFPLAEAAAAHAYLEGRKAFGRVVRCREGRPKRALFRA